MAPTPRFYRWTFASMWTPGPFETKPVRAFYYITDVDPSWPAERQDEHLRDFNYGALWAISIHEVFPGHFLHYQHLRQVASKLRKSILFSSAAFVEGWAHYCEQMMVDEGFRRNDPAVRLGQLAEALIRLCRFIVGIRLHCEDMSVEQGVRFFREEAFLEETSARREAERGTFDPSYIVYSAGKLMLLKLREDYKAKVGAKYSLRQFHDTLLGNGTRSAVAAPRPDARRGQRRYHRLTVLCLFTNTSATRAATVSSGSRSSPIRRGNLPVMRRDGAQAAVVSCDPVQGIRAGTSPTTPRNPRATAARAAGRRSSNSSSDDELLDLRRQGRLGGLKGRPRLTRAPRPAGRRARPSSGSGSSGSEPSHFQSRVRCPGAGSAAPGAAVYHLQPCSTRVCSVNRST